MKNVKNMESKTISISAKRQITIPQKYFEELDFGSEAVCELRPEGIFIRPVHYFHDDDGSFSEEILADLIAQGLSGEQLLTAFKEQGKKIRPAVEAMIAEAREMAVTGEGKISLDELFGAED